MRLAQVIKNTNILTKLQQRATKGQKRETKIVYKSRELEGKESAIGASHKKYKNK